MPGKDSTPNSKKKVKGEAAIRRMPQGAQAKIKAMEDPTRIIGLYAQGLSYEQMAGILNIRVTAVREHIEKAVKDRLEIMRGVFDERRSEEALKILHIGGEALREWERSKLDSIQRTDRVEMAKPWKPKAKEGEEEKKPTLFDEPEMVPVKRVKEKVRKGRLGDPAFLSIAKDCHKMYCQMTGLLAGDTVNNNTTNNQVILKWEALSKPPEGIDEGERLVMEAELLSSEALGSVSSPPSAILEETEGVVKMPSSNGSNGDGHG